MRVIHSPGHTVGHICLYLPRDRLLVAGDVFWCAEGFLERALSSTHLDLRRNEDTLGKLSRLDIESVVCYHGGLCASGAGERIRELVSG